jgi:diguanylate cyclase (GGDEF)-like protein
VFFVGAAAAAVAPLVVTLVPRERNRYVFWAAAFGGVPALTALQAYSGGPASGYAVLTMMAMVWFGLQASDRELAAGCGLLALCSFGPMLVFGAPSYPVSWGHAAILVLVGATVAGSLRTVARETRRLTDRLRRQATEDDLTGLLNRRGWNETANALLSVGGVPPGLVLIDLDGFKQVNDTLGHDEGDRVLAETAERMRTALGAEAVIARLGGDEFAGLLPAGTPDDHAGALARLRASTPGQAAFSAGLAVHDTAETLSELMRRADIALYAAKVAGGGTVEPAPRRVGQPA